MTCYAELQFNLKLLVGRLQMLKGQGFFLIEDDLPADHCEATAGFTYAHLDEINGEHESVDVGSMQCFWSADKYLAFVRDYKDNCSRVFSSLLGQLLQTHKILAMYNKVITFKTQDVRDRFAKAHRHYDSCNDQYKFFLFMRDVGMDNGNFEFTPVANACFKNKLALMRPWRLLYHFTHFTSTKRPYQSFSDECVQTIIDRGHTSLTLLFKQATTMNVNPSALIHRASPIETGCRYLSVAYF
jgi:hypothetical protein